MDRDALPQQRLSDAWEPGAWIGAARRACGPVAEVVNGAQGEIVETHPPQLLLALWKPQRLERPFLRRWPQVVWLSGEDLDHAPQALLREVPVPARLWVMDADVDWALLAEIVMRSESGLRPYQYQALQRFIVAERAATAASIDEAYGGDPLEHRRFWKTVPGNLDS